MPQQSGIVSIDCDLVIAEPWLQMLLRVKSCCSVVVCENGTATTIHTARQVGAVIVMAESPDASKCVSRCHLTYIADLAGWTSKQGVVGGLAELPL